MGSTLILILVGLKEGGKHWKRLTFMRTLGPITACVLGILVIVVGGTGQGIKIVGNIPQGEFESPLPCLAKHSCC
jgi:hypothetical protein